MRINILMMLSGTAKAELRGIQDSVSSDADPVKNISPPKVSGTLNAAGIDAIVCCCPEEMEDDGGQAIRASFGNIFAKRIYLGDNFFSFDEFMNKYENFVHIVPDRGLQLKSHEAHEFVGHGSRAVEEYEIIKRF